MIVDLDEWQMALQDEIIKKEARIRVLDDEIEDHEIDINVAQKLKENLNQLLV